MPTTSRKNESVSSDMSSRDRNLVARRRSTLYPASLQGRRQQTKQRPAKTVLTEEDRKRLARERFRKAVFKVKAMIRFGLPLRAPTETPPTGKGKKQVRYENTYQLEPEKNGRFKAETAKRALLEVINDNMRGYRYSRFSAPNFARAISTMAVDRMKQQDWPRYKYVCNVIIGENKGQSFDYCSRCLWNHATDNTATAHMKNETCFVVATVHAVYLE